MFTQKCKAGDSVQVGQTECPYLICYGVLMLLLNCKQSQDEACFLFHFLPTVKTAAQP